MPCSNKIREGKQMENSINDNQTNNCRHTVGNDDERQHLAYSMLF